MDCKTWGFFLFQLPEIYSIFVRNLVHFAFSVCLFVVVGKRATILPKCKQALGLF